MQLVDRIVSAIEDSGISTPAIMLNGKYLMYQGKRVYAEYLPKARELRYFVRQYDKNAGGRKTNVEVLDSNMTGWISSELLSESLFGLRIGRGQSIERCKIEMNVEHEFLIIESELYQDAKELNERDGRFSFSLGDMIVDADLANLLKKAFLDTSFVNYRDVVYANGTNRFVKQLTRKNKFYGIRPMSFVPVFIDVKGLYNPLNNKSLAVSKTAMYQMAVEKGRFVDTGDVSAYYLTHKEICEAFGMTRFVRFHSSLWYNIFIGLLQPTNDNFPNKARKAICWDGEMQPPDGLKRIYTQKEFTAAVEKFAEIYPEELKNYGEMNSLDAYISKEYGTLRQLGPSFIDEREKVTKAHLCEYYSDAKLIIR